LSGRVAPGEIEILFLEVLVERAGICIEPIDLAGARCADLCLRLRRERRGRQRHCADDGERDPVSQVPDNHLVSLCCSGQPTPATKAA
jgi:hypothetical protein